MCINLRRDALRIWQAGVDAVRPERIVPQWLKVEGRRLVVGSERIDLDSIRRIAVVGGGKAAGGMARAVESIIGSELAAEKQLVGWINVPADGPYPRPLSRLRERGDSIDGPRPRPLSQRERANLGPTYRRSLNVRIHPARPAGINEPTAEGVAGTAEILRLVESLGPDDLCICLLSGGGSALLPAPVEGITLKDKLSVTRHLSAAGANIEELNTVRKHLSRIKGGGLLRACRAGRLVSLIISDVLGDRLDLIASGPTVPDRSTPAEAIDILERFDAREGGVSSAVFEYLQRAARSPGVDAGAKRELNAVNFIIADNATAVAASAEEARRLGYSTLTEIATQSEGSAEEVGRRLAEKVLQMRGGGRQCFISGGEPVVKLVEKSRRGRGGRNQQLILAALEHFAESDARDIVLLSGGTDGEDGPTDAAGAFVDAEVISTARQKNLDPADYLARNDACNFFAPLKALLLTGPTGTNVSDLRVALIG
ncbi:MAG: DUF4147 domain-containing protein [Pirellulales bacterium]|nr:DUF4147 domain-containing protein [Pirellulales bacterium]